MCSLRSNILVYLKTTAVFSPQLPHRPVWRRRPFVVDFHTVRLITALLLITTLLNKRICLCVVFDSLHDSIEFVFASGRRIVRQRNHPIASRLLLPSSWNRVSARLSCVYVHTYTCVYMFITCGIYTYIYMYIYMYTHIHIYIYTYIHINIFTWIHVQKYKNICTCMCTYICIYVHTHVLPSILQTLWVVSPHLARFRFNSMSHLTAQNRLHKTAEDEVSWATRPFSWACFGSCCLRFSKHHQNHSTK